MFAILCLAVASATVQADEAVSRSVGRVVHGQPVVVDFGPQGEGGFPTVEIEGLTRPGATLRLSYATHPDGLGEKGDFWHETRATYLGADVPLPIPPASTDRFDVFCLTNTGTFKAEKAQGLVRYVRIAVDTPGTAVDVARVGLENRGVHSTEPVVGSFACSDEALTRLWQASARTCLLAAIPARGNATLPYLSDGAKRDRLVWSGDLWWAQRNMYVAFPPTSPYMAGSIDALAENQTPSGYVNACPYPESRGPVQTEAYGPFGSDEFAAWFVPVLADHYLYTGDRDLLKRRYPNVVKLMGYLAAHQGPDGLFEQRAETAKHSEGLAVGGTSLHHRAYLHLLLWRAYADAARLAEWMGRDADRTRFDAAAAQLAKLLRERFYCPEKGRFILSLEEPGKPAFVANAAAVAFGFSTGDEAARILAQLAFNDHGKFQLLAVRGAFTCGDGRKAGALIDAHRWRQVVEDSWPGTHLTSECMRLRRKGWGDEAHPDTALAGVLTDYVLGVRPLEPGYRTFVVEPVPLPGVTWAKGRVPTSDGFIDVEWKLVDDKPEVKVTAPAGLRRANRADRPFGGFCPDTVVASPTFVRGEHGLWRLKFADGTFLRETDCAPAFLEEGKDGETRSWQTDEADIAVRRVPWADGGYDLVATVRAKTKKVVAVDLPARVRFNGKDVKRFIYPGAGSTGLGMAFNDRMFTPQDPNRPDSWTDVAAPRNGCGMLLGGGLKTLDRKVPDVPLTVTEAGRTWFDPTTVAALQAQKRSVIRPCREGLLDLVLVDTPNGPYFGGRRLGGGEGRLWRFGTAGGNSWRWEAQAERAVLTNLVARLAVRNPSRLKVACIVLTGARNCGLFVNTEVAMFRRMLRESVPTGCEYVELTSPADIARAERASDFLLVVNPYGEGFPCGSVEKYEAAIESLKDYVAAGGNWVEAGGYSFCRAMVAADFSYRVAYPPLWADFACLETKDGASTAIYGLQPRPSHPAWTYDDTSFVPGETAFGVDAKGGWYEHAFAADVKPGQVWTTPRVRLCRRGYERALADYARANGLGRTLADKVRDRAKLEQLKKAPLFLLYGPAREKLDAIRMFPAPTTVHFCDYLKGTFDKQYPDHLPPHPTLFGTGEELTQVIAESHRLGHLVCPYTNPTWWCENPRGPTFEKWGMEPLAKKSDGSPYAEGYAAGNRGYAVSFWHPGVREANRRTIREFTVDYPVDLVFQDQCARAWIADYNPASPSPLAWSAGMLAMNEEDSALVPLGTEHGWDRVVANMAMVTGSTALIVPIGKQATSMPWRLYKNWITPDKWVIEPLASRLFHGTTLFYLHDLMASVTSERLLAWVMAIGYNMSYAHGAKSYTCRPRDRAWYEWLHVLQREVLSKAAGESLVSFGHDRSSLLQRPVDPADEKDDGVVRAQYGEVKLLVNLGDVVRPVDGRRLAAYGWWIEGPGVVSGNLDGALPFVKTSDHCWEYDARAEETEKMLICR